MASVPTCLESLDNTASVWITVNGRKAPVFKILHDETNFGKVSGIIESKEGCNFSITYADTQTKPKTGRVCRIYVDGNEVFSDATRKNHETYKYPVNSVVRQVEITGIPVGQNSERPFIFKKPVLTDNDELACKEENILKNLGIISVRIWRATVGKNKVIKKSKSAITTYDTPQENLIHEQVKKAALSHQVGYSAPVSINEEQTTYNVSCEFLDPQESPSFIFEFRYMSRALLEIDGYIKPGAEDEDPIPNLPTPERSPYPESWNSDEEDGDSEEEEEEDDDDDENEEDSDLDNLEAKELANAEAATQAIRDKIAKRKGEAGGSDSSPSKKSKTDSSTEGGLVKVKREPDNRDLGEMVLIDSDDEM